MDDPGSAFWAVGAKLIDDANRFKPHREDRLYLDSYRSDFHDVTSLMCQLQATLDPRTRERIERWVDVAATRPWRSIPRLESRASTMYRERLERHGLEVFYADLTTTDVAATGMSVVRVIVPGLVPNTPAAFQPFGRGRVQQAAVELGWRDRPLEEDALNTFPLPHA